MSSADGAASPSPTPQKSKRRWTFWRALRWILATLLLLIIIAAAYAWQNRYAFLESAIEDVLAEQGLDAQLSINSIKKKSANLADITIDENGQRVFSAKTLSLDYQWREALKGRVNRIELSDAQLSVTVDEKGKIIDGWMPASNPDSEVVLPPQGIHLKDTGVKIKSPYGLVTAKGNVSFLSSEDVKADFVVDPSSF